jgi:hypothetical protein
MMLFGFLLGHFRVDRHLPVPTLLLSVVKYCYHTHPMYALLCPIQLSRLGRHITWRWVAAEIASFGAMETQVKHNSSCVVAFGLWSMLP